MNDNENNRFYSGIILGALLGCDFKISEEQELKNKKDREEYQQYLNEKEAIYKKYNYYYRSENSYDGYADKQSCGYPDERPQCILEHRELNALEEKYKDNLTLKQFKKILNDCCCDCRSAINEN